jgi:Co/Zn/Cd efflux system component
MVLFWVSIVLAVLIGGCTLIGITNGIGLQIIGLVLAGNALVRLQRGKPAKAPIMLGATWLALAVSGIGLIVGVYRVLQ